jgi:hypothetical protein
MDSPVEWPSSVAVCALLSPLLAACPPAQTASNRPEPPTHRPGITKGVVDRMRTLLSTMIMSLVVMSAMIMHSAVWF